MLSCVLFDMDGLLIDSDPLQFDAYRQAFAEFGYDLDIAAWTRWHEVEASARVLSPIMASMSTRRRCVPARK